jgi:hypothetical protein
MAKITINGITVDPSAQESALAAANLLAPDASNSNYIPGRTTLLRVCGRSGHALRVGSTDEAGGSAAGAWTFPLGFPVMVC